jgi:lipopolysaccharide export system protein LptC
MRPRSLDRIAALISLALLTALGLLTVYLAQVADRTQPRRTAQAPAIDEHDYFVERLALLTMNERGEPAFRIEARALRHFPADDRTEFEEPLLVSLDPERPRVTVTAERGRLDSGAERAELVGDVAVTRAATAGSAPMLIRTEWAEIFPNRDLVRTNRPVTVLQGGNRLSGTGMEFDNRARRLQVDSRVRAELQPPPAPVPGSAAGATPSR